ncbi:hypothetical protein ACFXG4_04840 [Nocardia sp. NPDC059246]
MADRLVDMVGPVVAGMWGSVGWRAIGESIRTELDAQEVSDR